jgi:hypothetical protein
MGDAPPVTSGRPNILFTAALSRKLAANFLQSCRGEANTVDSRLSAVMVGRIGADNKNQRINRSTHTQARYTGTKLTSLIFYAIN